MVLPKGEGDREYEKFMDDGSGNTAVRVVDVSGGGVSWDEQVLGYVGGVLTTVTFNLAGVAQQTLTLGYDVDGNLITVTKS